MISRATTADTDAVAALTRAAYAHYVPLLGGEPLPMGEPYAPRISRGEVWILRAAEQLVGVLVLETHHDHAMIYSVAIAPDEQGRGHGGSLLDFAETLTRAAALTELRLYTNALMTRNIAIYAARGFIETGRRPNPSRPASTIVDMVKTLTSGRAA